MKKPILLQKKKLVNPIEQALNRIEKLRLLKMANEDEIILEGLFALAVSSFENSILDTLKILFQHIPDKIDVKNVPISKEHLIEGDSLFHAIEIKVQSIGYESLPKILTYFTDRMDISPNLITEEELNHLTEIKARRNLLIHNNLKINSFYINTAGPKKSLENDRLYIDQRYLFESLVAMKVTLSKLKDAVLLKYADYTKVNAIKRLFAYIFETQIMVFENEFEVDLERDVISLLKPETSRKGNLSSSERLYYDIWVAHSHGKEFNFSRGHFHGISNKDKLAYFINQLDLLKS